MLKSLWVRIPFFIVAALWYLVAILALSIEAGGLLGGFLGFFVFVTFLVGGGAGFIYFWVEKILPQLDNI
jgi:hypothetical protein